MRSHAITRSHAIRKRSHAISKKNLSFTTVQVLENASGTRSGTESLPKVFLHDNCEQISFIIFFAFSSSERVSSCYLPKFFFFTERAGPTRGRNSSTYWLAEIWGGWPIERERIF